MRGQVEAGGEGAGLLQQVIVGLLQFRVADGAEGAAQLLVELAPRGLAVTSRVGGAGPRVGQGCAGRIERGLEKWIQRTALGFGGGEQSDLAAQAVRRGTVAQVVVEQFVRRQQAFDVRALFPGQQFGAGAFGCGAAGGTDRKARSSIATGEGRAGIDGCGRDDRASMNSQMFAASDAARTRGRSARSIMGQDDGAC